VGLRGYLNSSKNPTPLTGHASVRITLAKREFAPGTHRLPESDGANGRNGRQARPHLAGTGVPIHNLTRADITATGHIGAQ
jgi:hypothetical protein